MEANTDVMALLERASKNKVSVASICRRADISESTVHRWRAGKSNPNWLTLNAMNSALDALISEKS